MDLIVPGISSPNYSTSNYLVMYFSGDVPDTQADFPFSTADMDFMVQSPLFLGTKCLSSVVVNRGRSGYDGCELESDVDASDTFVIPFGHIDYVGEEIRHYPKSWKYIMHESETLGGLLTGDYRSTSAFYTFNVLAMCASTQYNSTNFGCRLGSLNAHDFSLETDGIELTFGSKFVMSRQYVTAMYPQGAYLYYVVSGWDYDTEAWVELHRGSQTNTTSTWEDLEGNELSTDKYFVSKYAATSNHYNPGFTNLWFMSKAEDYVAPATPPEQPTWAVLMPSNIAGQNGVPFVWGSCSGPTGDGEFKVNDDAFKIGDTMQMLTRQFEVFSLFEGVSNES